MQRLHPETTEIVIASKNPNPNEIKYEIADFLYHMMVLMAETISSSCHILFKLYEILLQSMLRFSMQQAIGIPHVLTLCLPYMPHLFQEPQRTLDKRGYQRALSICKVIDGGLRYGHDFGEGFPSRECLPYGKPFLFFQ